RAGQGSTITVAVTAVWLPFLLGMSLRVKSPGSSRRCSARHRPARPLLCWSGRGVGGAEEPVERLVYLVGRVRVSLREQGVGEVDEAGRRLDQQPELVRVPEARLVGDHGGVDERREEPAVEGRAGDPAERDVEHRSLVPEPVRRLLQIDGGDEVEDCAGVTPVQAAACRRYN